MRLQVCMKLRVLSDKKSAGRVRDRQRACRRVSERTRLEAWQSNARLTEYGDVRGQNFIGKTRTEDRRWTHDGISRLRWTLEQCEQEASDFAARR